MVNKTKEYFITLFLTMAFPILTQAQEIGSFTDNRDGQVYETVSYSIQLSKDSTLRMTWMVENLNYKTEDAYCYDDYESNCAIMGRLYNWVAAMQACPEGWHLPDDEEWNQLAELFGGLKSAAKHLKSTSELWSEEGGGTNKSLFNAMPYGHAIIGSGYFAFTLNATFWSAENISSEYATDWVLSSWDRLISYKGHKSTAGNSVRCVQDGDR
ncbi:MAG: FISUMP domain-containing protein [Bacteroidota bacterium]